MTVTVRRYSGSDADFQRIGALLKETYHPGGWYPNWRQTRWEYALYHPYFETSAQSRIGMWEEEGRLVGVATYELRLGEAYFHLRPGYHSLKGEMLTYAEEELSKTGEGGRRTLRIEINERDVAFEAIAGARGYVKQADHPQWNSRFVIPDSFPAIEVPEGFTLRSLAEGNDLRKVNRVMHRGFNHPGEAPEADIPGRERMQSAPGFRRDLFIIVESPDGEYVAFAGLWYDPVTRAADVEPVATDPDYRRIGLGRAAVLEGIRRCRDLGATEAWVGSGQRFYEAIGFQKAFCTHPWIREW